jgi:hypothetical protein
MTTDWQWIVPFKGRNLSGATNQNFLCRSRYSTDNYTIHVIRWDNYLSIYLAQFGASLKRLRFLTHGDGDPPNFEGTLFSQPWELPQNLSYWLDPADGPWIVNVDLDFFYCCTEDEPVQMFSDFYLDLTFIALKRAMDNGAVAAVTLCLTPDTYTPGWEATEALATRALRHLGLDWRLP